ncbi:reverse transcriptase (RNA-dependent DNA polymerase) domain-containing protein [Hirsutella rhossiliensis]|uniref:Reverse transcriptase (RNA-dependent DNA polymerase) domain-containing protein n=1 Tax=Hirsutella rhossiliensis TaxID=111463 RepID=A0A9P8N5M1_9HYPO|nr:reverse transcriptase (RNA-dependent DNA polymerase) domain-containing protein [Hirsutella rhossiliensis]KAH0966386.1 reverse transcriptase (RNA-dependent DNA polymerase) domain-containing protein [Hirsutella rhossiliensis]
MIQQIEIPEGQTANQAILDEETDEDTDIEDFEDDDIRMAEDNEDEEQGQQQSEEQEKEDYGRARELEDAYLTPPASDPEEEEPHGVFSVHFPYADPKGVVVKAPFQVDLEPLQAQKRVRVQDDPEEEAHPEGEEFTQAQRDHLASHAEMGSFDEVFWTKAAGKQVLGCKWMDAVNAFVHAPLDDEEVIFMRMPPGFQKRGKVLRLRKALYGLRRSPLLWQQMLTSSLEELGFRKVPQEPCVMVKGAVTVFFYVDDIIWAFRKEDEGVVEEATRGLQKKINLTRLGEPRWFLGIHAYIDKIAYKFLLNNDNAPESLKLPDTPMISDEELLPATSQANEREKHQYLQKVGSVLFSAISTRPDIAFAVSRLARHNHNPDEKHQKAADRVILFLFATRSQFSRQEELTRLRHDPIWRISGESVKASDSHDVKHGG